MAKIAINGLGRIGRAALKLALENPDLEVVAVNDLAAPETLAYLLKYDTVYGRYPEPVACDGKNLTIGRRVVRLFNEKDPQALPWRDLGVEIVLECTGVFTRKDDLLKHLRAGASYAILSAPARGEGVPTVVYGANELPEGTEQGILSCASCTTNSITPVIEILGRRIGIQKATMTTVHAYTASQELVDRPSKNLRRSRAGAANLVPSSTGAAIATTQALPQYRGRLDGLAVRAPVAIGSIADIVAVTSRKTSVDEVNAIFREEARSERYKEVISVSDDEIVSSDIIRDPHAAIIDLTLTHVVDGDLVKVMSWYDNEWGYSNQLIREAASIARASHARVRKAGVGIRRAALAGP